MKRLGIVQNKGGEGKTTIARTVAEYFARQGKRTLAIDLDPQCNLSQRFMRMDQEPNEPDGILPPLHPQFDPNDQTWDGRSSSADLFVGREVVPYETQIPNLDLLPGWGRVLREVELVRKDEVKDRVHDRLREFLLMPDVEALYDIVVIDTPPTKGPLTTSAVRAATHVLIPAQMEQQSVEGLRGMMQLWRRENRLRTPDDQLRLLGVLPNKFRSNVSIQEGILLSLREDPSIAPHLLPIRLGLRSAFSELDHPEAKPKSVFDLATSNPAREEALAACQYLFQRLELEQAA